MDRFKRRKTRGRKYKSLITSCALAQTHGGGSAKVPTVRQLSSKKSTTEETRRKTEDRDSFFYKGFFLTLSLAHYGIQIVLSPPWQAYKPSPSAPPTAPRPLSHFQGQESHNCLFMGTLLSPPPRCWVAGGRGQGGRGARGDDLARRGWLRWCGRADSSRSEAPSIPDETGPGDLV